MTLSLGSLALLVGLVLFAKWGLRRWRTVRSFDGDHMTAHGFKVRGIERGKR